MERTRRRREILDAAAKAFAERGYHDTSVSDIITAAGIARGTFYLYFESKRAVFDTLIDTFLVQFRNCVRRVEVGPGAPPPYEQLRANTARVFALVLEERDTARLALYHAVGLDPESDQKLQEFFDDLTGALERALETGKRIGLVAPVDTKVAARMILGAFLELIRYVLREGPACDPDSVVSEILKASLCGVIDPHLQETMIPELVPAGSAERERKR